MAVEEGYKQTEIGDIPEDWEVISLGKVSDIKTGPFGSALHAEDYVVAGTPIITVEHLGESSITHVDLPMVSDCDKKRLYSYTLKVNDIVFSRVGSVDRNARVTDSEEGWLFSGRLLRIRFDNTGIDSRYLSYHFHFEPVRRLIRNIAVGQTMPSLNTKLLSTVEVVMPPLPEQKAIATALSDIDGLIDSISKLIEKKKNIKQGAMQELLAGKKRLDGFSGKWLEIKLCKICIITKGHQLNKNLLKERGRYYALNGGILPSGYTDNWNRNANTISISEGGESCGYVSYNKSRFWCGGHCYTLESLSQFIDNKFLFQKLKLRQKDIMALRVGSGLPNIQQKSLNDFCIVVPKTIEEQTAIATILSDMDSEIETLQAKLNKYKSIKQGMMQELLTGRIRLLEGV